MNGYLEEGTKVRYKNEDYSLVGEVVGLAGSEQAVAGMSYIIKIVSRSGNINYDYSCIVIPRLFFTLED